MMCQGKSVGFFCCCCCGCFSLGFLHEFLEFNNLGAFKMACQIARSQTMTIKKFEMGY